MDISKSSFRDGSDAIKIVGKINTYQAFLEFKQEIELYLKAYKDQDTSSKYSLNGEKFRIYFVRAYPLNSYVLGFLCKLALHDKINIETIVDGSRMFTFFEEIGLLELFEVKIREEG